jgi:ribosomal protein L35AE/L33A
VSKFDPADGIDEFSYNTGFTDGVIYGRRVTNANGVVVDGNILRLSGLEQDVLRAVLGEMLDLKSTNDKVAVVLATIYEKVVANDDV